MRAIFLSIAALAIAGCSHCPVCGANWGAAERERALAEKMVAEKPVAGFLSGTVSCKERVVVLPTYRLVINLIDLASGEIVAQNQADDFTSFPYSFANFKYSVPVKPDSSYGLEACLASGGETLFRTDTQYPVIARGRGNSADMELVRVR